MKKYILLFMLILGVFTSCNRKLYKALNELKSMPEPDYSYVVQPVFKETKEAAEKDTRILFNAEEVRIGAVGFHKYNQKTKAQEEQIYRMQTVLFNSKAIVDFKNENKMNELGRDIAKYVINHIVNSTAYDKIEICFIMKDDNSQIVARQNIIYKLPNLELTQIFDK